ncbi:MAG: cobalt-precorrin-5B (C(1))-methyltransferase CbiD [Microcoleaceae cyanobacterium]
MTSISSTPGSGYTLPVFACASAVAALQHLHQLDGKLTTVELNLVEPAETVNIEIEQVALLQPTQALAISRSQPGDNLDLTRNTPIWAMVEQVEQLDSAEAISSQISLCGGAGIGYDRTTGIAAIYRYAKQLFLHNLTPQLSPGEKIRVTLILPEGRQLAQRTSNAAFGVVEGLSLLGTTGIAKALTSPEQLQVYQTELRSKALQHQCLVFCWGENGLNLAQTLGIPTGQTVKTANWLGPMLIAAAEAGVESILLLGYHGKLIKLAGGIFHTHHHLADGRLEILTAHCAVLGLPPKDLSILFNCETTEAALNYLQTLDQTVTDRTDDRSWVVSVYGAIAERIDQRTAAYIGSFSPQTVQIGSVLFDRRRQIIVRSKIGEKLLSQITAVD